MSAKRRSKSRSKAYQADPEDSCLGFNSRRTSGLGAVAELGLSLLRLANQIAVASVLPEAEGLTRLLQDGGALLVARLRCANTFSVKRQCRV